MTATGHASNGSSSYHHHRSTNETTNNRCRGLQHTGSETVVNVAATMIASEWTESKKQNTIQKNCNKKTKHGTIGRGEGESSGIISRNRVITNSATAAHAISHDCLNQPTKERKPEQNHTTPQKTTTSKTTTTAIRRTKDASEHMPKTHG